MRFSRRLQTGSLLSNRSHSNCQSSSAGPRAIHILEYCSMTCWAYKQSMMELAGQSNLTLSGLIAKVHPPTRAMFDDCYPWLHAA